MAFSIHLRTLTRDAVAPSGIRSFSNSLKSR
jgi:hypothetical protein